jgi:hypothetical protein
MIVTNTESNTADAGHAISQVQFTFGSTVGPTTAFTELAGTTTDFASSPVAIDVTPPTSTEHWSSQTGSGTTSVWAVNSGTLTGGYGGQPNHLIVAAGSTPNASLTGPHTPSFTGPVDFFFADSTVPTDLTAADITGVSFGFGTQSPTLEVPLEPGTPGGSVPEPATMLVWSLLGTLGLAGVWWKKRTVKVAA